MKLVASDVVDFVSFIKISLTIKIENKFEKLHAYIK